MIQHWNESSFWFPELSGPFIRECTEHELLPLTADFLQAEPVFVSDPHCRLFGVENEAGRDRFSSRLVLPRWRSGSVTGEGIVSSRNDRETEAMDASEPAIRPNSGSYFYVTGRRCHVNFTQSPKDYDNTGEVLVRARMTTSTCISIALLLSFFIVTVSGWIRWCPATDLPSRHIIGGVFEWGIHELTPRKLFLPRGHPNFGSAVIAQNDGFKCSFHTSSWSSRSINLKTWLRNSIFSPILTDKFVILSFLNIGTARALELVFPQSTFTRRPWRGTLTNGRDDQIQMSVVSHELLSWHWSNMQETRMIRTDSQQSITFRVIAFRLEIDIAIEWEAWSSRGFRARNDGGGVDVWGTISRLPSSSRKSYYVGHIGRALGSWILWWACYGKLNRKASEWFPALDARRPLKVQNTSA